MYSKYLWTIAGLTRLISPPHTMPSSMRQECLVLASASFGLLGRWQTCTCGVRHCPHAASSRKCRSIRCRLHSSPIRRPPSTSQVTTSRSRAEYTASNSFSRAPSGSIFGCRRRGPCGAERIGRQRRCCVTQKRAAPIEPRRQPSLVEALAELWVDPQRGLVQIETFQAGRRNRQRRKPIRAPTDPPRLTQRHPYLSTENAHVAFQIPQPDRVESQAVALQPPQVIDQHVGVCPLRTRAFVTAEESVRLRMLGPFRPHDGPRSPSVAAPDLLNPKISYHHSPRHMPPPCPNVTNTANPVGKQPRDGAKAT